jgi:hypothetical protein
MYIAGINSALRRAAFPAAIRSSSRCGISPFSGRFLPQANFRLCRGWRSA